VTRNGNRGHVVLNALTVLNEGNAIFKTDNTYLTYKRGFLRRIIVYLKDLSPYRRWFSPYSKSQNTIRVNLLGNHSTSCYYVIDLFISIYPAQ